MPYCKQQELQAGQGQIILLFIARILTSLVCGLNQCEISLPALAMIGLSRTSPVESNKKNPISASPLQTGGGGLAILITLIFAHIILIGSVDISPNQSNCATENCACHLMINYYSLDHTQFSVAQFDKAILVTGSVGYQPECSLQNCVRSYTLPR